MLSPHRSRVTGLAVTLGLVLATGSGAYTAASEDSARDSDVGTRQTQPMSQRMGAPPPVRIAAAGDIACQPPFTVGPQRCRMAATAQLITSRQVDVVLPLGDTQYEQGRLSQYRDSYAHSWGQFKGKTRPVVGNHEYLTPKASGFFSYFGNRVLRPSGWYAFNLGSWRLYVLNSNCTIVNCDSQVTWLRNDLQSHPRQCSLAALHHPRFSSGEHGDSMAVRPLWNVLDNQQVDVVLAGHDHDYERFARRQADGDIATNGIRSFVVGTGGKSLRPFGPIDPASRFHDATHMGVLFMTLNASGYDWHFRSTDNVVRDSGHSGCVA